MVVHSSMGGRPSATCGKWHEWQLKFSMVGRPSCLAPCILISSLPVSGYKVWWYVVRWIVCIIFPPSTHTIATCTEVGQSASGEQQVFAGRTRWCQLPQLRSFPVPLFRPCIVPRGWWYPAPLRLSCPIPLCRSYLVPLGRSYPASLCRSYLASPCRSCSVPLCRSYLAPLWKSMCLGCVPIERVNCGPLCRLRCLSRVSVVRS